MSNFKKTVLAVLALGSSSVFAGTMGPVCTPGSVTVPCERMAWDLGAQALYLNASQNHYLVEEINGGTINTWDALDRDWSWGFKIEGSYHFSTGNDVNVNWYHLDQDKTRNFNLAEIADFEFVPGVPFGIKTDVEWDAVNFEFGQTVNFGEHKVIRFHGGAQYANIEQKDSLLITSTGITAFNAKDEFSGFGPRAGLDMSYHFGNGLAMYANAASALIIGQGKFSYAVAGVTGFSSKKDIIVPELEAKLGLTYNYAMAQGDLTLDAGWMAVNYFDALQVPGVESRDLSLNGPYIGAKWVGNVA